MERRLHIGAIFLISASGMAFQVTLTRVFSIAQWHHFAYMIISMAMLGFGVSGTLIALFQKSILERELRFLRQSAIALTISFPISYLLSQRIEFETFQLTTQPIQLLYLLFLYLILSVPFFLTSTCITLAFLLHRAEVGKFYAANMLGSGLGAGFSIFVFHFLFIHQIPFFLCVPAGVAASMTLSKRAHISCVLVVAAAVAAMGIGPWFPVRVSEYKGLSCAMRFPDAEILFRHSGPQAEITGVSSKLIRETPGQIGNYPMEELGPLPEQVALFFDAGTISVVNRTDNNLSHLAFLDYVTTAAPYHLVHTPTVLVLGAGGGVEVLNALMHGASSVTALDANEDVFMLVTRYLNRFSGSVYRRPDVHTITAEGRGFLLGTSQKFDLIQIPAMDSFSAAGAGVHALSENYLYTQEALTLFLDRLTPTGCCSITRWLKEPPRDAIKLFATAVSALEQSGVENPGDHLAFIRSWNTGTVVMTHAPLSSRQIQALRLFSKERNLDLAWLPGLHSDETNRYTMLSGITYFEAAQAILSPDRKTFLETYPFHVQPATDDCPYFSRFFRWKSLRHIISGMGTTWIPFVEWGYLTLLITLLQALLVSSILILVPVLFRTIPLAKGKCGILFYFGSLGFAFMFLEIAMMQKIVQFLTHPVYAIAVVLSSFLVFSGLGSQVAHSWQIQTASSLAKVVIGLGLVAMVELLLLPIVIETCSGFGDPTRILISIVFLAPLGFFMGIPFPSGLQILSSHRPKTLAWAWAINGFTSVLGASTAVLLAIHLGFRALVFVALLLYTAIPVYFSTLGSDGDS